jgi:hypothetical protein
MAQAPTKPETGALSAATLLPQKHCVVYSSPAIEYPLLEQKSIQLSTVIPLASVLVGPVSVRLAPAGSEPHPMYLNPFDFVTSVYGQIGAPMVVVAPQPDLGTALAGPL